MRILICGLPGSGKTTLAAELKGQLESLNKTVLWFNADLIREQYNDWDFSIDGRIRQSSRMAALSYNDADYCICDFVAPTEEIRTLFNPDYTIWLDTIKEGRFTDTNNLFEIPNNASIIVTEKDSKKWVFEIIQAIT